MNPYALFLAYWFIMLVFWWFLVGKNINEMYKNTPSHLRGDRQLLIFMAVMDIFLAPVFMPLEIGRRTLNRLCEMSK